MTKIFYLTLYGITLAAAATLFLHRDDPKKLLELIGPRQVNAQSPDSMLPWANDPAAHQQMMQPNIGPVGTTGANPGNLPGALGGSYSMMSKPTDFESTSRPSGWPGGSSGSTKSGSSKSANITQASFNSPYGVSISAAPLKAERAPLTVPVATPPLDVIAAAPTTAPTVTDPFGQPVSASGIAGQNQPITSAPNWPSTASPYPNTSVPSSALPNNPSSYPNTANPATNGPPPSGMQPPPGMSIPGYSLPQYQMPAYQAPVSPGPVNAVQPNSVQVTPVAVDYSAAQAAAPNQRVPPSSGMGAAASGPAGMWGASNVGPAANAPANPWSTADASGAPPPATPGAAPGQTPPTETGIHLPTAAMSDSANAYWPALKTTEIPSTKIYAIVGTEFILAGDVIGPVDAMISANLSRMTPEQRKQYPAEQIEAVRQQLIMQRLDGLIETKMVLAELRRKIPADGYKKFSDKIADQFDKEELPKLLTKHAVATPGQLDQKFKEAGTSLEKEKKIFIERYLAMSWMHEQTKTKESISHEEMVEYYQKHPEEFEQEGKARWEQLLVRFDRYPSKQAAFAAIAQAGNRVLDGVAFATVAREVSQGQTAQDGGVYDWTTQGSLASDTIDQALFSLPIGKLSPILEDTKSFQIVRVLERKTAGKVPFQECQADIKERIKREIRAEKLKEYVTQLRDDVNVWNVFRSMPRPEQQHAEEKANTMMAAPPSQNRQVQQVPPDAPTRR